MFLRARKCCCDRTSETSGAAMAAAPHHLADTIWGHSWMYHAPIVFVFLHRVLGSMLYMQMQVGLRCGILSAILSIHLSSLKFIWISSFHKLGHIPLVGFMWPRYLGF